MPGFGAKAGQAGRTVGGETHEVEALLERLRHLHSAVSHVARVTGLEPRPTRVTLLVSPFQLIGRDSASAAGERCAVLGGRDAEGRSAEAGRQQ
jgi:hypothetical protein